MNDYRCDRCGWSIAGKMVETHLNPSELKWVSEEMMAASAEMTHLLGSGCMGSLVEYRPPPPVPTNAGWTWIPGTQHFERIEDGFRLTGVHINYYGFPPR